MDEIALGSFYSYNDSGCAPGLRQPWRVPEAARQRLPLRPGERPAPAVRLHRQVAAGPFAAVAADCLGDARRDWRAPPIAARCAFRWRVVFMSRLKPLLQRRGAPV